MRGKSDIHTSHSLGSIVNDTMALGDECCDRKCYGCRSPTITFRDRTPSTIIVLTMQTIDSEPPLDEQ